MFISRFKKVSYFVFILLLLAQISFAQYERWEKINISKSPSNRYDHSMVFDTVKNVIILYGGYTTSGRVYDTWEYNNGLWRQITTQNHPKGSGPGCMVYDSNRQVCVFFGGYDGNNYLNETWEFNGTDWIQKQTQNAPSIRYNASMAYDSNNNVTVLFGGYTVSGTNQVMLNDTWIYNGTDWTQINTATKPEVRSQHTIVYDSVRSKIILFGGKSADNKLWEFNGTDWAVINVTNTSANIPAARYGHSMAYDVYREKIILYGGYNFGKYYNDTWEFNTKNNTWKKITTTQNPNYPFQGAMIWSSDDKRIYYFGGKNDTLVSDQLWYFSADIYASGTILFKGTQDNNYIGVAGIYAVGKVVVADYNLEPPPPEVTVKVTSENDPVGFNVTLKHVYEPDNPNSDPVYKGIYETRAEVAGKFGFFYFDTVNSNPSKRIIKVADQKKVFAEYFYPYKQQWLKTEATWRKHEEAEDPNSHIRFNQSKYEGLDQIAKIKVFDLNSSNDPFTLDTKTIKVTSEVDEIGFTMDLLETQKTTGIFDTSKVKNLLFTLGQSDSTNKRIKIAHKKKITAQYYSPFTGQTYSTEAIWGGKTAILSFDKDYYINIKDESGETKAYITLYEPEKNLNPNLTEQAICRVYSDTDKTGFYITLWETQINPDPTKNELSTNSSYFTNNNNVYNKPITFTGSYTDPINYKIKINTNDKVYVEFIDNYPSFDDEAPKTVIATAIWKQKSISVLLFDKKTFVNEKQINVTMLSNEMNNDVNKKDIAKVSVRTTTDNIGTIMELEEENVNSGLFKGRFYLSETTYSGGLAAALVSPTLYVNDGDDIIAETTPDNPFYAAPLRAIGTYIHYVPQSNEPNVYIADGPEEEGIVEYNQGIFFRLVGLRLAGLESIASTRLDYQIKLTGVNNTWITPERKFVDADGNITLEAEGNRPLVTGQKVEYANLPDGEYTFYVRSTEPEADTYSYHKERIFYVGGVKENKRPPIFKPPVLHITLRNDNLITLQWTEDKMDIVTGYYIFRRNINAGPFIALNEDPTSGTVFIDGVNNTRSDTYPVLGNVYEYFVVAEEAQSGKFQISNFYRVSFMDISNKAGTVNVDKIFLDFGIYGTEQELILSDVSNPKIRNIKWTLTTNCPFLKFDNSYGELQQNLPFKIRVMLDRRLIQPGSYNDYLIFFRTDAEYVLPDILQNSGIINLRFAVPRPVIFQGGGYSYPDCAYARFPYISDGKITSIYDVVNIAHPVMQWGSGNGVIDYDEEIFNWVQVKNTGGVGASSVSCIMYEEDKYVFESGNYYCKYNEVLPYSSSPGGANGVNFITSDKVPETRAAYQTNLYFLTVDNNMYQWFSPKPITISHVSPIELVNFDIDDDNIGGSRGNSNELIDPNEMIETRSTIYNSSLFPFTDLSMKLNSQATNCIENFHYCAWDDISGGGRYRFRDIFFTSNYPSTFTRIDFGRRTATYQQPGYFESKQTYTLTSYNQDIEFRTFTDWIGSPYNHYEVPASSDGGGYMVKNPRGTDVTRNYQGEEIQFEVEIQGLNVYNNGIYRSTKVFYENPFIETLFEDDFTSNELWMNDWVNSNIIPGFGAQFDPLEFGNKGKDSPGYLSITTIPPDDPNYQYKGQFGFWASPMKTVALDLLTTHSPSINGYYIPSDYTAYSVDNRTLQEIEPTYLYRAGFLVAYTSADPNASKENCPNFRFRIITEDFEQANTLEVVSAGSGSVSPYMAQTQEYSMIFIPHACNPNRINLAYDVLNFDPANLQDYTLYLAKTRVERTLLRKLREWKDIVNYDFSFGTLGWLPLEVAGGVKCEYANKALNITSANNTGSYGFWNSPTEDIVLKPNRIYRAQFDAVSNQTDAAKSPIVRFRMGSINNQISTSLVVNNIKSDSGPYTTTYSDAKKNYEVYFAPPKIISTSTDNKAYAAFDVISIDPGDALNSIVSLRGVKVQETKHINWNTFDRKYGINLLRDPGFEGSSGYPDLAEPAYKPGSFWEFENLTEIPEAAAEIVSISTNNGVIDETTMGKVARRQYLAHRYNYNYGYNITNVPFVNGLSHGGKNCYAIYIDPKYYTAYSGDIKLNLKLKQKVPLNKNVKNRILDILAYYEEFGGRPGINDIFQSGFYFAANNRNYGTNSSPASGADGRINNKFVENLVIYHEITPVYNVPDDEDPLGVNPQKPYVDTARYFKEVWQYKSTNEYLVSSIDLDPKVYSQIPFNVEALTSADYVEFVIHIYAKFQPKAIDVNDFDYRTEPFIICIDDCELRVK